MARLTRVSVIEPPPAGQLELHRTSTAKTNEALEGLGLVRRVLNRQNRRTALVGIRPEKRRVVEHTT